VVDPIGSGDSVLSGVVQWIADGQSLADALKAGVAAGTANALFAGGAQFSLDSFQNILAQVTIDYF
jgi:fructose-1-phosphate kinase PfkB-like protein